MTERPDIAQMIRNWLRQNANAETCPKKREALIEAHNAALKVIEEHR